MNFEIAVGRIQQVCGKLLEIWGRLMDNEIQQQRGYQLVCVGRLRVLGGRAIELLRYCTPRQALGVQPLSVQPVRIPRR